MKCLTVVLVIVHLYIQLSFVFAFLEVKCNDACKCFNNESPVSETHTKSIAITCSTGVEMTLIENYYIDITVSIKCIKPKCGLSVFYGIEITTDLFSKVIIEGNYLLNSSLSALLASIGVKECNSFYITSYNGNLHKSHFENLKINELTFTNCTLGILPVGTFKGLTNLKKLTLQLSSFSLTGNIFRYTPELEVVYLLNNNKSKIYFNVFNNLKTLLFIEIIGTRSTIVIIDLSKGFFAPQLDYIVLRSIIIIIIPNLLKSIDSQRKLPFAQNNSSAFPALNSLYLTSVTIATQPNFIESTNSPLFIDLKLREVLQKSKLTHLELTKITARTFQLQPGCFAHLPTLFVVKLSGNRLKCVPEDAFSRSTSINKVDLSHNLIETFEEKTFSDLSFVETLNLSHNQISHLPEQLFSRNKNLEILDLSYNLLKTIEPNWFSPSSHHSILNPSHNKFRQIQEKELSHIMNVNEMYLSHNQIEHISEKLFSQLNVNRIDLSHNRIRNISGEEFSQLKSVEIIDLSHNQLSSLLQDPLLSDYDHSVFYNCTNLYKLLLQNNSLTEIYDDWRMQLTKLSTLDMSYNEISDTQTLGITSDKISTTNQREEILTFDFRPYAFKRDFTLTIVISNNTFNCNCDLVTSLCNMSHHVCKKNTVLDDATCRTPARLENFKIAKINWTTEYEECTQLPKEKWQQCPERCRCVHRPFYRSYVINCQHMNLTTYPRILPALGFINGPGLVGADHTELLLYGNSLLEFHLPDDPGYKNVTYLNLANNLLSTLNIRGVSKRLKKLDIRNNKLKTLSDDTLALLEDAQELERLELQGNPWTCDITNYRLVKLIFAKQHLIRYNVTCADKVPIEKIIYLFERYLYTQEQIARSQEQTVKNVVVVAVLIFLVTVFVLTVLYYRNRKMVHVYCFSSRWRVLRWLVSHPDLVDDDKLYDAFIVFSQEDETLVVDHLVPHLEVTEDRKYKLCLHYRDWIPGEQILTQIGRSVRSSRRTIVVLSPHFLRSVWGVAEFRMAHAEALKDGTARVIVVLYEDVSEEDVDEELKTYLQTNTYLRWGSPWFWKQLTYALPHPPDRERGELHYFTRGPTYQRDLRSSVL